MIAQSSKLVAHVKKHLTPDWIGTNANAKEGKLEDVEKYSGNKDQNQQQPQPTYDARSRNQTWVTVVGGRHYLHCTIPASHKCLKERSEAGYSYGFRIKKSPEFGDED